MPTAPERSSTEDPTHAGRRDEHGARAVLVLAALLVLAFNLRPAAASVGPLIEEVEKGVGLSSASAGLLTALPVLAFAAFGGLAPWLAGRLGVHRLTTLALVSTVAGLAWRAVSSSPALFLLASVVGLAGMATANVLLPSLVKLHFPTRVGLVTSLYTTVLATGLALASTFTVPAAEALGSWRWGLGVWALAAVVAVVPWVGLLGHDVRGETRPHTITMRQVAGTRLGRLMAVAFGLQSLQAYAVFGWVAQVYRDAGYSATEAGLLLGLLTAIGIPVSLLIPALAARRPSQVWLMLSLLACLPVGLLGLAFSPTSAPWLWAVLIGLSQGTFPLILTLLGLRTRTSEGTAALSGFAQSTGYLVAALGPFGMSVLHEATGGWKVPLVCLAVLALPLAAAGVGVSRPAYVEDELDGQRSRWRAQAKQ
jgi:CP family cyanate transporter-like MFS transporter